MKTCSKCKEAKPLEDFYKDATNKTGYRSGCKGCHQTPDQVRAKTLKQYGVTNSDYEELLEKQGHVCSICKEPETATYLGITKSLCVDHCHDTGKVRGLLCRECNLGIGYFKDNPTYLQEAIRYLS